jgi:hypothetical protein
LAAPTEDNGPEAATEGEGIEAKARGSWTVIFANSTTIGTLQLDAHQHDNS